MATWQDYRAQTTALPQPVLTRIDTLAQLHSERVRRGVSQRELAARIGMSQPQLAKVERLDSVPSFKTLNRYAAGLGLKLKVIVTA
ncbi:helix-turn-helix domain-containing protein [Lacticaseibacillus daqingensis]|uniref:helix-turn-helix domain-containing protein n=1 Tax=Lacticaseibacillus daqingensis TaxID=2486014 RepID=UPI000F790FE6|nr:helix-turn-helix transcriptional regulator [Lacticaseibacillus daqingensis]